MITRFTLVPLLFHIFFVRYVCSAQNNTNGTSVDRIGLVGAMSLEDLIYKTAIACEGQKLYIACPNIYYRIQVHSTFYGREDAVTCKHPELPSDKICADQNVTVKNVVWDLCQGEEKCEVSATNDFLAQLGTIICPNVYKYLYVKYRCVPETALPDAPGLLPYDHATSVTSTVTTHYAPVQCCYIVPGVGTSQTTTTVGGTIVRQNQGIQSVEERIVSEIPQVQQTNKVTEIIGSHPIQIQTPITQPAIIPDQQIPVTQPAIIPDQQIPVTQPAIIPDQQIPVTKPALIPDQQIPVTKPALIPDQQIPVTQPAIIPDQQIPVTKPAVIPDQQIPVTKPALIPDQQTPVTKPAAIPDQQIPVTKPAKVPDQIQKPATQPAKIPLARITLPGISNLQLKTLIQDGHKTHVVTLGSPQIRSNIWGIQKKSDVIRPYISPRNKTYFVPRTQKTPPKVTGKIGKHMITVGSPQIRRNSKGLQKKSEITRRYLSPRNKTYFVWRKLKTMAKDEVKIGSSQIRNIKGLQKNVIAQPFLSHRNKKSFEPKRLNRHRRFS